MISDRSPLRRVLSAAVGTASLALLLSTSPAANAQSLSSVDIHADATLGPILSDSAGRTLYVFTKDWPGISTCYDQCATAWPPLLTRSEPVAPAGLDGLLGATERNDGSRQVTYNGMPLYYWAKDTKPGDTTGQKVGGVWFVVNPAPAKTVNIRQDPELGMILTDIQGMTLYMFSKDDPGVSNCYDQCATAWPPLVADTAPTGPEAVSDGLGLADRADGTKQVTYNEMPLYYWNKDTRAGDASGQNVGGVWFIVNP